MRNKVLAVLLTACISLGLAGCKSDDQRNRRNRRDRSDQSNQSTETTPVDTTLLDNAESVYDITSLLTLYEDNILYSECKKDKDIHFYFDILSFDEYIKVEHNGKEYLLFWYDFSSYGLVGTDVRSIDKTYTGYRLDVDVNLKTKEYSSGGCFPNQTRCRMIVKMDQQVDYLFVAGVQYHEYDGGEVYVCGRRGVADEDLNFILPPIYEGIEELETFEPSYCPMLYRVFRDGKNGVLDSDYNPVLSMSYDNIYYLNEDRFIVSISKDDDVKNDVIALIDRDENILKQRKGFLCADTDSNFYCFDGQIEFADPSYGPSWGFGVMDQELNTIIEPVYYSIFWVDGYYKVENHDNEVAHFNERGVQTTEFTREN